VKGVQKANGMGMVEMEKYGDRVEEDWEEKTRRSRVVEEELEGMQSSAKRQRTDGQHVRVNLRVKRVELTSRHSAR
jgi:hypothetical protein